MVELIGFLSINVSVSLVAERKKAGDEMIRMF